MSSSNSRRNGMFGFQNLPFELERQGSAQNLGKAECSNCKFLAEKIKTLEAGIRILEGQLEMERHPENHTLESAAILYKIYNGMGNLIME
ncbi:hypothetical protein Tco_0817219 [Tanacetum coccineum]